MRILFVSSSPLKKEISIGNTFINLFDGMENVELASVYTRSGMPDTEISKAFCITEKMLIRNLLGKGKSGKVIDIKTENKENSASSSRGFGFVKAHRWTAFFWMQNLIWKVGRWKSKELESFVKDVNPDIIFTVFSSSIFLNNLILHIGKIAKAPVVLYAWDNNYSMKRFMFSPLKWINLLINRSVMRKTAKKADVMYVISEEQKADYEKAFTRGCKILTKGADFSNKDMADKKTNEPVRLVYTGNIGLNRWKALSHIANVLEKINKDGVKAQLRIYSGNDITQKMKKALDKDGSSFLMGSVSAEMVEKIQNDADVLVHVESDDIKNRLLVRQSFSTKLVDYFHQAKCILAFGPKDVASIAHLIRNDAAIVADSEEELEEKMRRMIENPDLFNEYGEKAWNCGKKHHNKEIIQNMLMEDLKKVIGINEGSTN